MQYESKELPFGERFKNRAARKKGYRHKHNPSNAGLRMFARSTLWQNDGRQKIDHEAKEKIEEKRRIFLKNRSSMGKTETPVYCHLGRDKYGNVTEDKTPNTSWYFDYYVWGKGATV